jgi:hypothetical protein
MEYSSVSAVEEQAEIDYLDGADSGWLGFFPPLQTMDLISQ